MQHTLEATGDQSLSLGGAQDHIDEYLFGYAVILRSQAKGGSGLDVFMIYNVEFDAQDFSFVRI